MNQTTKTVLTVGGIVVAVLVGLPLIWGGFGGWSGAGWGMMGGGVGMGVGGLVMVLFWGLIIWAVVAAVQGTSRSAGAVDGGRDSALEILKQRYARGEIGKEEYEAKRHDLA